FVRSWSLDRLADGAEDARHLRAEEDQRDDRDDRDEREDQRGLRETLALVLTTKKIDESVEELHWGSLPPFLGDPLSREGDPSPPRRSRCGTVAAMPVRCQTRRGLAAPPPDGSEEPATPDSAVVRPTGRPC